MPGALTGGPAGTGDAIGGQGETDTAAEGSWPVRGPGTDDQQASMAYHRPNPYHKGGRETAKPLCHHDRRSIMVILGPIGP